MTSVWKPLLAAAWLLTLAGLVGWGLSFTDREFWLTIAAMVACIVGIISFFALLGSIGWAWNTLTTYIRSVRA